LIKFKAPFSKNTKEKKAASPVRGSSRFNLFPFAGIAQIKFWGFFLRFESLDFAFG